MRTDVGDRVKVHAALADPVRLGIVDELALSDRSPSELAQHFSVRPNLLAHHLDVLAAAGLIERIASHGDRRRRYARLIPDALAATSTPLLEAAGVVFVCTRNSARSQLAASMWNCRSEVDATSAGTDPADAVASGAIRAARRHQLDLGGATPSRLDLGAVENSLIVTVCDLAHEELAALPSVSEAPRPLLHWSVPDPVAEGGEDDFDHVIEMLDRRVSGLAPFVHSA